MASNSASITFAPLQKFVAVFLCVFVVSVVGKT